MPFTIAIDLGTTYSAVAVMRGDKTEIIPDQQGNRTTPSYVAFLDRGNMLIGHPAKAQAHRNPVNTLFDAKRLIGRGSDDVDIASDRNKYPFKIVDEENKPKMEVKAKKGKKLLSPEEVSGLLLGELKKSAESYLNEEVTDAVITVPAYFNDSQRQATKDAATIAGLTVTQLLNEPTAAAIAYGLDKMPSGDKERNVLIFDLGGGTFDVSVLALTDNTFEVLATSGNCHLGGEDFDDRILMYVVQLFDQKNKCNVMTHARALRRLRTACETAKREQSSAKYTTVEVDNLLDGADCFVHVSRAKFEDLIKDYLEECRQPVHKALTDAKLTVEQIDDIVLVGGSTRIPKIQQMLSEMFGGKELNKSINPDEAVACGAAIQAAAGTAECSTPFLLMDVTPLSLGVGVADGSHSIIVPRNTRLPVTKSSEYTTSYDFQKTVKIEVYEGERALTSQNKKLGDFRINGITATLAGQPQLTITFFVDLNGILSVSAVESASGSTGSLEIDTLKGRLSKEEIDRMIADAQIFKDADAKVRARLDAINKLESYITQVTEAVTDASTLPEVTATSIDAMKKTCNDATLWLSQLTDEDEEPAEIEEKLAELQAEVRTLFQKGADNK